MKYGTPLIVLGIAVQSFGQVSPEEAAAKLKEREAARAPASKPYDETVALRKALADARGQADKLRQENSQLKSDLKKAQDPAAQEQAWSKAKVGTGMSLTNAAKIFELNNWRQNRQKMQDFIGKVPIDVEVWTRDDPNPEDFRATQVDSRLIAPTPGPNPGQPKTVILVNDVVVYVSPK